MADKDTQDLARKLIIQNLKELDFYISNFKSNKIKWTIGKIRKLLYSIREEKYPKEEEFINSIENINIELRISDKNKCRIFYRKRRFYKFKEKYKSENTLFFPQNFNYIYLMK